MKIKKNWEFRKNTQIWKFLCPVYNNNTRGMEKAINMQISVYIIIFIRYPDDQNIGKPNILKIFGSNKAKWAKQ